MSETVQLILCGIAVLFVALFAIRIVVGTIKLMYAWAPVVVFLGALFAICYMFDSQFHKDVNCLIKEVTNADNIGSAETQSGCRTYRNEWNNN